MSNLRVIFIFALLVFVCSDVSAYSIELKSCRSRFINSICFTRYECHLPQHAWPRALEKSCQHLAFRIVSEICILGRMKRYTTELSIQSVQYASKACQPQTLAKLKPREKWKWNLLLFSLSSKVFSRDKKGESRNVSSSTSFIYRLRQYCH